MDAVVPTQVISLREEHADRTRAAVVKSARALFGRRGYAEVGIQEIVDRARVTRGALYHHFSDKREVFFVICEQLESEIGDRVAAQLDSRRAQPALALAGREFLEAATNAEVQQIVFIDAPAVLGWEGRHELDARYLLPPLEQALQQLGAAARLRRALAHQLLGGLIEA